MLDALYLRVQRRAAVPLQQRACPRRASKPAVRAAGGPDAPAVVLATKGGGRSRGIPFVVWELLTVDIAPPCGAITPCPLESEMELVQSVLAVVAFVRAGKYSDAAIIAFRLVAQLLEQFTGPNVIGSAAMQAVDSGKTTEQLCDDLEAAVTPKASGIVDDLGTMPPILIPILLALVQRLIAKLLGG